MAELTDIRETVRERYASAAQAAASGAYGEARALESESGCCGSGSACCSPADETGVFGATLYDEASREEVPGRGCQRLAGLRRPNRGRRPARRRDRARSRLRAPAPTF